MEIQESVSEVARFRKQLALEEQAIQLGFSGFAAVAYHAAIIKRMEIGAERVLHLVAQGKHEEAQALMSSDELWQEGV